MELFDPLNYVHEHFALKILEHKKAIYVHSVVQCLGVLDLESGWSRSGLTSKQFHDLRYFFNIYVSQFLDLRKGIILRLIGHFYLDLVNILCIVSRTS